MFNPMDNREYIVNDIECRILEQCNGVHTLAEIAGTVERDFGKTNIEAFMYTSTFINKMHRGLSSII